MKLLEEIGAETELLNKYVGVTERKIREIFRKAKEKAADDVPVVL